jgi:hypothetical protein
MAFCVPGMFNMCVTQSLNPENIAEFRHWLEVMSDEEFARWLNEPEQKKLWKDCPSYFGIVGPDVKNEEPIRKSLAYDPKYCELPPDLMFAHEAIFPEDEPVEDVDLSFPEYRENWWDEVEADRNIVARGNMDNRVDDYLKNSKKISCLC